MGLLQKRIDAIKFCQFSACKSLGTLVTDSNSAYLRKQLREIVEEMRQEFEEASKIPGVFAGHERFLDLTKKWLGEDIK